MGVMTEAVVKIVSQVMGVPVADITQDSSPDTIESWDSHRHMNLVLALEEEFDVMFGVEEITEMLNVGLVDVIVESKLGAR